MDIKNKTQFIEYFSRGIKDIDQIKIGVEHERFLFFQLSFLRKENFYL